MSVAAFVDTLLDRAVVPGYSRIGWTVRRALPDWPADPAPDALAGRVVAVTGANSGLGKATALGAARLGAEVRMLCRDAERGAAARDELTAACPGAAIVVEQCDVSSFAAVRETAARLTSELPALHALVHNAGVMPAERTESMDGHELTLATHVLGPHLLIEGVRGLLAADAEARVVFVSSGGMYARRLPIDDLEYRRGRYGGTSAYARTKRMQVVLAEQWAHRLHDEAVAVHAMHPGWAATPGITESLASFARAVGPILRTPGQGADTAVWLLAAPDGHDTTGLFWQDRRPRPVDYLPYTRVGADDARRLWDFCDTATGITRPRE